MARPRLVTDEEIVESVRACVLEHGPHVSLDRVAERLGVSPPALLKRFGSRQAIILASLIPRGPAPWAKALEAGPDDRPIGEQIADIVFAAGAWYERIHPFISALRESNIPHEEVVRAMGPEPPPLAALAALSGWLRRAATKGLIDEGGCADCEIVATALMGAIQQRIIMCHFLKREPSGADHPSYLAGVADLFTRALAPVAKPKRTR